MPSRQAARTPHRLLRHAALSLLCGLSGAVLGASPVQGPASSPGSPPAPAQPPHLLRDRTPAEQPSLLFVGLVHFSNPGLDINDVKVDDVLAPKRQQEIAALVERLAAYKPDHVAVEWPASDQARLDQRYQAYRAGKYTLTRDEVDQIGLRLAARLDLPRVDAVDWQDDAPGQDSDYDFEAWARAHGQTALLKAAESPATVQQQAVTLANSDITGFLCNLNDPAAEAADQRAYFDFAMIGDSHAWPGANWVGAWYARNLKITVNLVHLLQQPSDRAVVLFGAGHGFLLQQNARQSGAFKLDSTQQVLGCADAHTGTAEAR